MSRMISGVLLFLAIGTALLFCSGCGGQQFPRLTGPYFGMDPPGMTAQPFAPEVFREEVHSAPIFSPDSQEVYWGLLEPYFQLRYMRIVDGVWTQPTAPPFSTSGDSPVFSPDGSKLYFSQRQGTKELIYFVERTAIGWSAPAALPGPINSMDLYWQLSFTEDEDDVYFGSKASGEDKMDIYQASLVDGQYAAIERLGDTVNTELEEDNPFIARDGSYLLFYRTVGGTNADIYVSFPQADGTWCEAIAFGESVNSRSHDCCPRVSDDGKYLFFISVRDGRMKPYWVDAQVIEDLRPR